MNERTATLLFLLLASAPAIAGRAPSPVTYVVEIEPLLVTPSGLLSIAPTVVPTLRLEENPALHSHWQVGPADGDLLIWRVECRREGEQAAITVGRTLRQGETEKELPEIAHRMPLLDSWVTTLWEGPEQRLDLRVVILVRREQADEPLNEGKLGMWIKGGPLIVQAPPGSEEAKDEVVFVVNGGGMRGVSWGIPGLGVVKLAMDPFAGSVACGSVRGHRLSATVGGRELLLVSEVPILPDDPARPGFGWTLFGKLEPETPGEARSFYGGFDPSKER